MRLRRLIPVFLCLAAISSLSAYNPPAGGEFVYEFYSPLFSGGGPSVSATQSPSGDALNPASQAALQRFTMEASYLALVGLGAEVGWGHVVNVSASIPKPFGVWGLGLRFVNVPEPFVSMPLGNLMNLRATFAKDIYPNFWLGMGAQVAFGERYAQDWSIGADIGVMHTLGKVAFLQNFRYGIVAAGLGKWYAPQATAAETAVGPANLDRAFPSPFTLKTGAGWDFFKKDWGRLSMTADLSFPFFQNVILDTGINLDIMEAVNIGVGWGVNFHELSNGTAASLIPSFSLGFSFPIATSKSPDSFLAKQGWDKSELKPVISAAPLYGNVWAFGVGAVLPFGVVDKKPPKITITYPQTAYDQYYLSPNADGKNDELVLPVSITDERFVEGYALKISDAEGKPVREILNKEERPENQGVKGFFNRLVYSKKGVSVPPTLVWDGRSTAGQIVPDGQYTVTVESQDDNGNKGASENYKVFVDATPPSAKMDPPADPAALVFSPDQDGSKDTLTVKASGTKEDAWKIEVRDAAGNTVRKIEQKDSALTDIVWDGKNDAGQVVPDGVYRVVAASEDRGGNNSSVTLDNVVIDTRQPPVSLTIDSGFFSPNGDGSRDKIVLGPSVPVRSGLSEWAISVKNDKGEEVWSVSGKGDTLKSDYAFDGRNTSGKALPEGSYRAELSVSYVNGHKPSISSPAFILDLTPPKASVKASAPVFSPNGDGRLDSVTFDLEASQEDLWTGEILDAAGKAVQSVKFAGKVDPEFVWDGTDEKGALVPDGTYSFALKSVDRAGNPGSSTPIAVKVDTEKKSVMLGSDLKAFSPNGDGVKESLSLIATIQAKDNVAEQRLERQDRRRSRIARRELLRRHLGALPLGRRSHGPGYRHSHRHRFAHYKPKGGSPPLQPERRRQERRPLHRPDRIEQGRLDRLHPRCGRKESPRILLPAGRRERDLGRDGRRGEQAPRRPLPLRNFIDRQGGQ
jgi:flagellar hook assembly protein FlgD